MTKQNQKRFYTALSVAAFLSSAIEITNAYLCFQCDDFGRAIGYAVLGVPFFYWGTVYLDKIKEV